MSNIIAKYYRTYIPRSWRDTFYRLFLKNILKGIRSISFFLKTKFYYLKSLLVSLSDDKSEAWAFMGKYGKTQYPGVDISKYKRIQVEVLIDQDNQLPYVMHHGKRLYFPKKYRNKVEEIYRTLLMEQDPKSAHRYMDSCDVFNNKILLDIGAAEGIISLDAIGVCKFVYLFEYDEDWIEALNATFEPYKDKVQIIKKYISNVNNEFSVTLDSFFENRPMNNLFMKMDIEGSEINALQGASQLLTNAVDLGFSISVYHKKEDKITIPAYLRKYGYNYEFSNGYLLMDWWLRKGIIRSLKRT